MAGLDKTAIGFDKAAIGCDKLASLKPALIKLPLDSASIKTVAGRPLINCLCRAIAGRASES